MQHWVRIGGGGGGGGPCIDGHQIMDALAKSPQMGRGERTPPWPEGRGFGRGTQSLSAEKEQRDVRKKEEKKQTRFPLGPKENEKKPQRGGGRDREQRVKGISGGCV